MVGKFIRSLVWCGVVLAAVSGSRAIAADFTWNGGTAGTWTSAANWLPSTTWSGSTNNVDTAFFPAGGSTTVTVPNNSIFLNALTVNRDLTLNGTSSIFSSGTAYTQAANTSVTIGFANASAAYRLSSAAANAFNTLGANAQLTVNVSSTFGTSSTVTTLNAGSLLTLGGALNASSGNVIYAGSGTVAYAAASGTSGGFKFYLNDTTTLSIKSNASAATGTATALPIIAASGTNTIALERSLDLLSPVASGTGGALVVGFSRSSVAPANSLVTNAATTVTGPWTLGVNLLGVINSSSTAVQRLVVDNGATVQVGDSSSSKAQGISVVNTSLAYFQNAASSGTFQLDSATGGMLRVNADSSFNAATAASGSASIGLGIAVTGSATLVNNGAWTNRNFQTTSILQGLSVASTATLSGTGSFLMTSGNSGQTIGKSVAIDGTVAPGDVVSGANGVGTLTISSGTVTFGSTSKVVISGSNATLDRLILNAPVSVTSGAKIDFLGTSNLTQGRYQVLTGSNGVNTFTASNAPAAYTFGTSGTDAYLWAKPVFGTITATPAAAQVITGGTVAFSYTVANSSPTGGQSLNFTSAAGSGLVGTVSGTTAVAATGTSGSLSGFSFVGSTTGAGRKGTFTVSDPNALSTSATGTVSVDVYGHASGSATGATIALPDSIVGYSGSLAGLTSATISNAAGYLVNLKTLGTTSAGGVSINNVSGIAAGGSAAVSASASLDGTLGVGLNTAGQSFSLTYADDSTLAGASNNLGSQSITVTGRILDHATPAFATAAGLNVLNPLTTSTISLDFGSLDVSAGKQTLTYSLTNLASQVYGSSLTAGLALTGYTANGSGFESGLGAFTNLAASGTSSLFSAAFTPTTEGSFSRAFTLTFYDNQSLAGSTQQRSLTVTMQAIVVPEPGALAIAGVGVILTGWQLARRGLRGRSCSTRS